MSKLSYEDKINLYNERKNGCSMGTLSKKYKIAVHGVQYKSIVFLIKQCQGKTELSSHLVERVIFYDTDLLVRFLQFLIELLDITFVLFCGKFDKFIILKQTDNILFQTLRIFSGHKLCVFLFQFCQLDCLNDQPDKQDQQHSA